MQKPLGIYICHSFYQEALAVLEQAQFTNVEIVPLSAYCQGGHCPCEEAMDSVVSRAAAFSRIAFIGCEGWQKLRPQLAHKVGHIDFYPMDNCFGFVLNEALLDHYLQQGYYMLNPGRVIGFKATLLSMGFTETLARDYYGDAIKKLLVLDTGVVQDLENSVIEAAAFLDLPYEILPVGLEHAKLFLSNIIMKHIVVSEKAYTNLRLADITRQTNDYSLVFDQIHNLASLRHASEFFNQVFTLFNLLFSPENMAFIFNDKKVEPLYFIPQDRFLDKPAKGDACEESFELEIKHQDHHYGTFIIKKIAFPEYEDHYKDLALNLNSVIGLSLANMQLFMQVKENEAALDKNSARLQELIVTKDKLLSIIAHDLINPFNAIIGLSDLLLTDFNGLSADAKISFIRKIHCAGNDTLSLLQNLLRWAKVQSGQITFSPKVFDLLKCIQEVQQLVAYQAEAKNIEVKIEVFPRLVTVGDRDMIQTVIRNLVTNAIKFSMQDSEIIITAKITEGVTILTVSDSGVGIPSNDLPRIFGSYGTVVTQGTEREKGTGIGLILCKEFVEKHGGNIEVSSEEGVGTTFTVRIPSED